MIQRDHSICKENEKIDYLPNSFSVDEEEPRKLLERFYHMRTMKVSNASPVNTTYIITRNISMFSQKTPKLIIISALNQIRIINHPILG